LKNPSKKPGLRDLLLGGKKATKKLLGKITGKKASVVNSHQDWCRNCKQKDWEKREMMLLQGGGKGTEKRLYSHKRMDTP